MQVAEVGAYKITLYKNNDGLWDFWIKQKGHLLVKSTGTGDCKKTKLLIQKHLYDTVMTKKEKEALRPKPPVGMAELSPRSQWRHRNRWLKPFQEYLQVAPFSFPHLL
jgi:hypothetical protein